MKESEEGRDTTLGSAVVMVLQAEKVVMPVVLLLNRQEIFQKFVELMTIK